MNLLANTLRIGAAAAMFLAGAGEVFAQVEYRLLRPLPNFPAVIGTELTLTSYLQSAFYLVLGLSATAAVILGIVYGFAYMTSDVVVSKENAKKHLTQIVWGIGLLLASYLILYTINPRLVNLDAGLSKLRVTVPSTEFSRPQVPREVSQNYNIGARPPTTEEQAAAASNGGKQIVGLFDYDSYITQCMSMEATFTRDQCEEAATRAHEQFSLTCGSYLYTPSVSGRRVSCSCTPNPPRETCNRSI
ncbi:pilin [Candidatus Parcubacteria bacterium]|nr:pilin [Candidatus Parcubacteria bacterium]